MGWYIGDKDQSPLTPVGLASLPSAVGLRTGTVYEISDYGGNIAVVLHALAAFGLVLTVVVHAYAAIWVKGTVQAMTRGTVSAGWARHHHPLWYRDQMQGRSAKAQPK